MFRWCPLAASFSCRYVCILDAVPELPVYLLFLRPAFGCKVPECPSVIKGKLNSESFEVTRTNFWVSWLTPKHTCVIVDIPGHVNCSLTCEFNTTLVHFCSQASETWRTHESQWVSRSHVRVVKEWFCIFWIIWQNPGPSSKAWPATTKMPWSTAAQLWHRFLRLWLASPQNPLPPEEKMPDASSSLQFLSLMPPN